MCLAITAAVQVWAVVWAEGWAVEEVWAKAWVVEEANELRNRKNKQEN